MHRESVGFEAEDCNSGTERGLGHLSQPYQLGLCQREQVMDGLVRASWHGLTTVGSVTAAGYFPQEF